MININYYHKNHILLLFYQSPPAPPEPTEPTEPTEGTEEGGETEEQQ